MDPIATCTRVLEYCRCNRYNTYNNNFWLCDALTLKCRLFYISIAITSEANVESLNTVTPSLARSIMSSEQEISKVVTVEKPIPLEFDLGHLTAFDINPLASSSEGHLLAAARDGTQLLLNAILSCPIQSTNEGVLITLPEPVTRLPRAKPIPSESSETKWAKFARLKGIKGKNREGKMVFDEEKQDWVPKWGYRGQNKFAEEAWAVELDDKKADDVQSRSAIKAARLAKGSANGAKQTKNADRDTATAKGRPLRSLAGGIKAGGKVIRRSRRH